MQFLEVWTTNHEYQSNWIVRMNEFFQLLSFLKVMSIIFVQYKLIKHQINECVHGRIISMMKPDKSGQLLSMLLISINVRFRDSCNVIFQGEMLFEIL